MASRRSRSNEVARSGPPEKVTHLIVQTRWFPLYREDDGVVVQRLVASEKDTDTLAREILASGQIRSVPEVSGPMPDLGPFTALRSICIENVITTPLPESLGETHRELRALELHEWQGPAARVPASLRNKPIASLTLPAQAVLPCGLDFPELVELVIPIGLLHEWRSEIDKLRSLVKLVVTKDESGVHELPKELVSLAKLRHLRADHLELSFLPPLPASLAELSVVGNHLTSLAPRFGGTLERLDAQSNPLAKAEADWIEKEMAKAPAKRSPAPSAEPAEAASSHHGRYFHPTWEGIGTLALAGSRVVIGRRGGFGVAAFDLESGELVWDTPLDLPEHPRAVTSVGFHDGVVIAQGRDRVFFLDPGTGVIVRAVETAILSHAYVAGGCLFGLGPDPVWWGNGGGMAYRIDAAAKALTPMPGFENIGAVSASGRYATTLGDGRTSNGHIAVVEVATHEVTWTHEGSARHAFRADASLFVIDDNNVAHEHALDGKRLRKLSLGADMAALPVNRRARPAVPYLDPSGGYLVVPRVSARKSIVDNTVAIFSAESGALLRKTTPHTPLRGNLDPRYYGDEYSPVEHPAIVRHGDTLLVGALVRTRDEPLVGTGLTAIPLPPRKASSS